nr:hypothetical protein [Aurantimonas sp. CSK15Z-1]
MILGAGLVIGAAVQPVAAQDHGDGHGGGASLLERGFGLFGGGKEEQPGAYASPSAIPGDLVPSAESVGAPQRRPLDHLDPIALPKPPAKLVPPDLSLPGLPAYAPLATPTPQSLRSRETLVLEPRLQTDGPTVPSGVVWRVFSPITGIDGKLPLVATASGGPATFTLAPGDYVLYAQFGHAGLTKRISFEGLQKREVVVLDAGGLKLDATCGDGGTIPPDQLRFDIYSDAKDEHDRRLIANDVPPDAIVRLNAGLYHVVSNYGSVNAVIRADIRVEAGKITRATLEHHAARLTMKLVREHGGEAIADTAWSISTMSGDVVRESVGAFPTMVLAEGEYLIVAKNKDRIYQRDFVVEPGVNTDVEVLTSDVASAQDPDAGSGD